MRDIDSIGSRVSAWADLVRLPNLPTVWTNTLVGLVLGVEAIRYSVWGSNAPPHQGGLDPRAMEAALRGDAWLLLTYWPVLGGALLLLSLIYIGGMAMHDWCDAPRDASEKPSRPIVRGGISRQAALAWAAMGLGLGLILLFRTDVTVGLFGCGLVGLIVAYNLTHHRWFGGVVLLGLIRGWLIFGVAWCMIGVEGWRALVETGLPIAVIMAVYVTLVSVIARVEDDAEAPGGTPSAVAWWIVPAGLVAVLWSAPLDPLAGGMAAGCGAMLLVWLIGAARRVKAGFRGPAVGMYLAGIALVDAYTLALLGRPGLSAIALVLFGLALMLQRWRAAGRAT
ncbi:MAG: UbiA family prenyltransferase [Planctomycetota bacterium]